MRIYHLFFLFFLLCMQSLNAKNQTETFRMPRLEYAGEVTCNLPPPASLNVNGIGATWVQVSWPAVPGAVQYRLQAFDGALGNELATPLYVSGTTTNAVVSTAGNNGSVFVRIWSVCAFGEYETSSFTQSDTFDSIVLDLVTTGFTVPNSNQTQEVTYNPGVPISWTGVKEYFKAGYNGETADFALQVKANQNPDLVSIIMQPGGNEGKKLVLDLLVENNKPSALLVRYRSNVEYKVQTAQIVATLRPILQTTNGTQGYFYRDIEGTNDPACIVVKVIPQAPPLFKAPVSQSINDRDAESLTIEQPSVRPNPFRDAITVQMPVSQEPTETVMHLYDLLGARLMTYHVPANQPECTLNTSQLKTGVYFLRIESNGKLETIKLLKTE